MCGRIAYYGEKEDLKEYGSWVKEDIDQLPLLRPNYNGSPSQLFAVATSRGLEIMRFGLIPAWAKDPAIGYKMINARSETIASKPAYSRLLNTHRAIVPVNGFFEWKVAGKTKQPMFIQLKDRKIFGLAAIWDHWKNPQGKEIKSFSIITCQPNSFMSKIHNRMPVVLEKNEEDPWIKDADYKKILDPIQSNVMTAYPVSKLVNRPSNNSPEVIKKEA